MKIIFFLYIVIIKSKEWYQDTKVFEIITGYRNKFKKC